MALEQLYPKDTQQSQSTSDQQRLDLLSLVPPPENQGERARPNNPTLEWKPSEEATAGFKDAHARNRGIAENTIPRVQADGSITLDYHRHSDRYTHVVLKPDTSGKMSVSEITNRLTENNRPYESWNVVSDRNGFANQMTHRKMYHDGRVQTMAVEIQNGRWTPSEQNKEAWDKYSAKEWAKSLNENNMMYRFSKDGIIEAAGSDGKYRVINMIAGGVVAWKD